MKKIKYLLFFNILFFLFIVDCNAAPTTYNRDIDNPRIPDKMQNTIEKNPELINTILNVPAVDEKQKIYDFIDTFDDKELKSIKKQLVNYTTNTKFDSVIVITDDLKGYNLAEYAYKFYDYNEFSKNGIIFLIYKESEDNTNIFMGNSGSRDGKIFKIYTDEKINAILRYLYDNDIRKKDYLKTCEDYIALTDAVYLDVYGKYQLKNIKNELRNIPLLETILIACSITFIIVLICVSKFSIVTKRRVDTIKKSLNKTNMVIKCEYDRPIQKSNE